MAQQGWNRPSVNGKDPAKARTKSKGWKVPLCGLALALCAAGIWYAFMAGEPETAPVDDAAKKGRIKDVTPAVAPKPEVENPTTNATKRKVGRVLPIHVDEHGVRRYENGARVFDEKTPMRKPVTPKGDPPIFKHWSLNELASFMTLKPGAMLFGTRKYDKRYLEGLKKGLAEKIEFDEKDDESTRKIKEEMIEVQKEFRAMSDDQILKTVNDTYSELMRLARYKNDVEKMVREVKEERKGDLTEQDYADIISAANEMLKKEGIAPIRDSVLIRKNIKMNQNKLREENKQ